MSDVIFIGENDFKELYKDVSEPCGDYKTWLDYTAKMRDFNIATRLTMDASFASVLLHWTNSLPFVFHLWGASGGGKTVALMLAASIWGNPNIGRYVFSANNTHVAFERISNFLKDFPLICDELHLLKGTREYKDSFDNLIMTLCSGVGKGRGKRDGGIQSPTSWRNAFIFNGEFPITTNNMGGGSKNRVIEIEAEGKLCDNGKLDSDFLRKHYGHGGRQYISILQEIGLNNLNGRHSNIFEKLAGDSEDKQALSMANILLADEIVSMYMYNVPPLTVKDVKPFMHNKSETLTYKRAQEWLLGFITANKIRFTENPDVNKGERWGKICDGVCTFQKQILEAKCMEAGFNLTANLKEWSNKEFILKNSQGKNTFQSNGVNYLKINFPLNDADSIQIYDDEPF